MSPVRVFAMLALLAMCLACVSVSVSASRQSPDSALQPVIIDESAFTPQVTLVTSDRNGNPMVSEPAVRLLAPEDFSDEPAVSAPTTPAAPAAKPATPAAKPATPAAPGVTPSNCATVLSAGCKGPAVLAVQQMLVTLKLISKEGTTSNYTPTTEAAVKKFQTDKGLKPADGKAGPATQAAMKKAIANPTVKGADGFTISAEGREQMKNLLDYAKRKNNGPYAYYGRCFEFVWKYLMGMKGSYGLMSSKNQPPESHSPTPTTMGSNYARYFADYFNQPKWAAKYGIQKLNIKNAYDAPPGSIVVVGPGTPGTGHPHAGDITVSSDEKMGSDSYGYSGCTNCHYFINDASRMNYGDPRQFVSRGKLLGVFAPL